MSAEFKDCITLKKTDTKKPELIAADENRKYV